MTTKRGRQSVAEKRFDDRLYEDDGSLAQVYSGWIYEVDCDGKVYCGRTYDHEPEQLAILGSRDGGPRDPFESGFAVHDQATFPRHIPYEDPGFLDAATMLLDHSGAREVVYLTGAEPAGYEPVDLGRA